MTSSGSVRGIGVSTLDLNDADSFIGIVMARLPALRALSVFV